MPKPDIFIPDQAPIEKALIRTTHVGIGAHQDDLEIMAFHGIAECFGKKESWFTGITCTDGGSSPREGSFAKLTVDEMKAARLEEQKRAAKIGEYSAMIQLGFSSSEIKNKPGKDQLQKELIIFFSKMRPSVLYTHNPADKHETHLAVVINCIEALRNLSPENRPKKVYGCEVWRGLDWLSDEDKVALDVTGQKKLAQKLLSVFESQIAGGKRYDLATLGRRQANATYYQSRVVDKAEEMIFALDLTPLVQNPKRDIADFVLGFVDKLRSDIARKLR